MKCISMFFKEGKVLFIPESLPGRTVGTVMTNDQYFFHTIQKMTCLKVICREAG